jgi:hypothetical protein
MKFWHSQILTLLLSSIVAGCCSRPTNLVELNHGFYHYRTNAAKNVDRWTLKLRADEDERIITEGLIEDDCLLTLSPTVPGWGQRDSWGDSAVDATHAFVAVEVGPNERIVLEGKEIDAESFARAVDRAQPPWVVLLRVRPPVAMDYFLPILDRLSMIAVGMKISVGDIEDIVTSVTDGKEEEGKVGQEMTRRKTRKS